jgi:hypothetical protein
MVLAVPSAQPSSVRQLLALAGRAPAPRTTCRERRSRDGGFVPAFAARASSERRRGEPGAASGSPGDGEEKFFHFPISNCTQMRYTRVNHAGRPWTRTHTEEGSMAKAKKKVAKKPAKKAAKKTAKKKTVKKAKKAKK